MEGEGDLGEVGERGADERDGEERVESEGLDSALGGRLSGATADELDRLGR